MIDFCRTQRIDNAEARRVSTVSTCRKDMSIKREIIDISELFGSNETAKAH